MLMKTSLNRLFLVGDASSIMGGHVIHLRLKGGFSSPLEQH